KPTMLLATAFVIACGTSAFAQPFESPLTVGSSNGERLAQDSHDQHGAMPADAIGSASVKFQTSCAPAVKDDFNKAVALLHSFWFPEAVKAFDSILARDPNCAMAHWGIALSHWGNPFAGIKQGRPLELTKASIDKAQT